MKNLLAVLLIAVSTVVTNAQGLDFGIGIGSTVYWGDLNGPSFTTNMSKNGGLSGQFFARYRMSPNFGLRGNLLVGSFKGNDANSTEQWQKTRNLNFKSRIAELSVSAEYYILPGFFEGDNSITPFVSIGLGGLYFDPTTEYNAITYKLRDVGTEGQGIGGFGDKYGKFTRSFLFGGGALVRVTDNLDLNLAVIGRRANSDYLDDVSKNYVSREAFLQAGNEIAAILGDRSPEITGQTSTVETGTRRGGQLVQDYYFTFMVSAVFQFGGGGLYGKKRGRYKGECPSF